MNIWYAIPSKRSPKEANRTLVQWIDKGYLVAVFRDVGDDDVRSHITTVGKYPGYAVAVNQLCADIIRRDPDAQWIVTGGDDVLPDPKHTAVEIGQQSTEHFGGTFGVMQPTGDRWCEGADGLANADKLCYSPWMGREFCRRMYGGKGPLFESYSHMGVDEELQEVAIMLGVLWQRRDLIHQHEHWSRTTGWMPQFLERVNSTQHWANYKALIGSRRNAGFPGHEPLEVADAISR